MENEMIVVVYDVVCHTENCSNSEIVIPVNGPENDITVICGVCSNPITDITVKSIQE